MKDVLSFHEPGEEPPDFPDSYHRARRMLALFSALMLSWEYVRVRPKVDDQGFVSPNLPVFGESFVIQAPEAIPNVMFVLVLYFSYRFGVEWFQSPPKRRAKWASKVDGGVSTLLSLSATLLFAAQRISADFLLSDIVTAPRLAALGLTFATAVSYLVLGGAMIKVFLDQYIDAAATLRGLKIRTYLLVFALSLPALWAFLFYGNYQVLSVGIGGVASCILLLLRTMWILPRYWGAVKTEESSHRPPTE